MTRTVLAVALLTLMMPTNGRAADADAQVATLSKQYLAAMIAGDTKALDAIVFDDWTFIDPNGDIQGKAEHTTDLKDGTLDYEAIDPSEVKVRVYGDAAVATGCYRVRLKYMSREVGGPVRVSNVYTKQGGKWQASPRR